MFLSEDVDDIKMAGKKKNMAPMWKKLVKLVDLGEPTSCLDHVYLDVLNVIVKRTKVLWTDTEKCSNHEFLQQELKSYQGGRSLTQRGSHGLTTWKDKLKHASRGIVNWQTTIVRSFNFLLASSQRRKTWKQLANFPPCVLKLS